MARRANMEAGLGRALTRSKLRSVRKGSRPPAPVRFPPISGRGGALWGRWVGYVAPYVNSITYVQALFNTVYRGRRGDRYPSREPLAYRAPIANLKR